MGGPFWARKDEHTWARAAERDLDTEATVSNTVTLGPALGWSPAA